MQCSLNGTSTYVGILTNGCLYLNTCHYFNTLDVYFLTFMRNKHVYVLKKCCKLINMFLCYFINTSTCI